MIDSLFADGGRRCGHAGVVRWSEEERGCYAGGKHDEQLERIRARGAAGGEHQVITEASPRDETCAL